MALEFADSNRGRVTEDLEDVYGVQNVDYNGRVIRLTSSSMVANKGTTVSDELRSDSMVSDLVETDFSTGGDLAGEWIMGSAWEPFLRAATRGEWSDPTSFPAGVTFTVDSASNTYTASAATFTDTQEGDFIYFSNFTNEVNNGWKQVRTVTSATEIVVLVTPGTLINESGVAVEKGYSRTIFNGVEKKSFNIEQFFPDLSTNGIAQMFLGQRVGTWSLNVSAGSIVTTTWGLQGTEVMAKEGEYETSTPIPAPDDPVVGATADVGSMAIDFEELPCRVQSISLNLDNGLRVQNSVGSKFPCGIGYGRQTITGNITLYFQNLSDYTDFINHESVALYWDFQDAVGNHMRMKLPHIKYTTGSPQLEGIDTDVMISCDFQALAFDDAFVGGPRQIEIASFITTD